VPSGRGALRGLLSGMDLEITGQNGQLVQRLVMRPTPAAIGAGQNRLQRRDQPVTSLLRPAGPSADATGRAQDLALEGAGVRLDTTIGDFSLPLLQAVDANGKPLDLPAAPQINGDEITAPFAPASSASLPPAAGPAGRAWLPPSHWACWRPCSRPSDLVYSTFLGGSGSDRGYDIAVDGDGNTYVIGSTHSSDFPTTTGAFDTSYGGGSSDIFVTKVDASGTAPLVYATFMGGNGEDYSEGIAIDGDGNVYVTGYTYSSDFPTTTGAVDTVSTWCCAFVTKVNASGTAPLIYSTFLDGSSDDYGEGIAVDGSGNAYVTGYTYSSDFPTTTGAFNISQSSYGDVFVTKVNASGTAPLIYSTFLGGNGTDKGHSIAVDSSGNAYVIGYTTSSDFPTTTGASYKSR